MKCFWLNKTDFTNKLQVASSLIKYLISIFDYLKFPLIIIFALVWLYNIFSAIEEAFEISGIISLSSELLKFSMLFRICSFILFLSFLVVN